MTKTNAKSVNTQQTQELLKLFLIDETKEKSFELSNRIKEELILLQEQARKNVLKCETITHYLLVKQVMFLINADKNKCFNIESDIKNLSFKFSVFTENMSNAQINYYNRRLDLNIPENKKEVISRDEEAEELLQALYSKGIAI